jgi:hypothetical protein
MVNLYHQLYASFAARLPSAAPAAAAAPGVPAAGTPPELPVAPAQHASLAERSKAVVERRLDQAVALFDVNVASEQLTLEVMRLLVSVGVGGKALQASRSAPRGCPATTD